MAKNITSVLWEATNLPAGLSINPTTGVISGTPTVQPGTYTAIIKVTTNYGTDSKTISIVIAIPESWLPVIDPNQVINCEADAEMTPYTVTGQNVTLTNPN